MGQFAFGLLPEGGYRWILKKKSDKMMKIAAIH